MTRFATAALALAVHLLPASGVAQEPRDARAERVDSLFSQFEVGLQPGLAVAVVQDGRVLLSRGYGFASLEYGVPITSSTVFDVASVSKQFTGMAVAMLVEQGRIRLDDDVRAYIPELPDFGAPITIDHLVHHTSGLRDWPGALAVAGWRYDDVISFEQILTMAYNQRALNFPPGSEYTYSNTGYNLLAEVVTRVTGESFREWTDAHIFGPLGMTRSHFRDDHTDVIPDRAFGYQQAGDGTWRRTPNNLTALGSSSLFSTAEDLARWLVNFETAAVGGHAAMDLTRTRGVLNDGSSIPYAFGLSHGEVRGLPTLTHTGSWASFRSFLGHFPEQRLGIVVLANTGAVNASRAAADVAEIFLDDELPPRLPTAPEAPAAVRAPTATLDAYAGVYRLGPGWYLRIRRDGSELLARATREEEVHTTPLSETEFHVDAYGASLTFHRDSAGEVTHLTYRDIEAPKLEEPEPPIAPDPAELTGEYVSAELDASYRVEVEDGSLVIRHRRHGTIRLAPAWGDDFVGSTGFMRSVEFQRDDSGRVVGLLVNAGERNRDLHFVKVR